MHNAAPLPLQCAPHRLQPSLRSLLPQPSALFFSNIRRRQAINNCEAWAPPNRVPATLQLANAKRHCHAKQSANRLRNCSCLLRASTTAGEAGSVVATRSSPSYKRIPLLTPKKAHATCKIVLRCCVLGGCVGRGPTCGAARDCGGQKPHVPCKIYFIKSADVTLLLNSWCTGGDQSYYAICMCKRARYDFRPRWH